MTTKEKRKIILTIIISIIVGIILGVGSFYITMVKKTTHLDIEIKNLEKRIENLDKRIEALEKRILSRELIITQPNGEIVIPLNAGWKPEGPGAVGGGYREGILELRANLKGSDDYAELFLDLRAVHLPEIERNPDKTYNLSGREIIAIVRSDKDFKGVPGRPNGSQFLLKDKKWKNLGGTWMNITDAMNTENGMTIFYRIPENMISSQVAGISLKFTIGTGSRANYDGSFFVRSIKISR